VRKDHAQTTSWSAMGFILNPSVSGAVSSEVGAGSRQENVKSKIQSLFRSASIVTEEALA
jgi:hypothetical protein